jgi:hypothetical protein
MSNINQKAERPLFQFLFFFLAIAVALALAAGIAYRVGFFGVGNQKPEDFPGTFGRGYGVTDFSTRSGEEVAGLYSTTLAMNVEEKGSLKVAQVLDYTNREVSKTNLRNPVNVLTTGTTVENNRTFDIKFYGGSKNDYSESTFGDASRLVTSLYDIEPSNLSFASSPTMSGTRTVDITMSFKRDESADGQTMKLLWNQVVDTVSAAQQPGTVYNISVTNTTRDDRTETVEGFFYDENTLAALKRVSDTMWSNLGQFTTVGFDYIGATNITYVKAIAENDETVEFRIPGANPGPDAVNGMVNKFVTDSASSDTPYYPGNYIVKFQYADDVDPAQVLYPSSINW